MLSTRSWWWEVLKILRTLLSRPDEPDISSHPILADIIASEGQMVEEYKIIQIKLDKIGEFKFHVKNWAFTLTLSILVGGFAAKLPVWSVFFCAITPSLAFCLIDRRQDRISALLGKRANYLEKVARRNLLVKNRALTAGGLTAPPIQAFGIAQAIIHTNQNKPLEPRIGTDNLVYLVLLFLCLIACIGASKRETEKAQQIGGNLSIALSSQTRSTQRNPSFPHIATSNASSSWLWSSDPDVIFQYTSLEQPFFEFQKKP